MVVEKAEKAVESSRERLEEAQSDLQKREKALAATKKKLERAQGALLAALKAESYPGSTPEQAVPRAVLDWLMKAAPAKPASTNQPKGDDPQSSKAEDPAPPVKRYGEHGGKKKRSKSPARQKASSSRRR